MSKNGVCAKRGAKFWLALAALLGLTALASIACQPTELVPRGNWGGVVVNDDDGFAYSANFDGRLLRFAIDDRGDLSAGQLDTNWNYPSSAQSGFGVSYTRPVIVDGDIYATGFSCGSTGVNCVSQIASVEIEGARQNWIKPINTSITGAPAVFENTVAVATAEQINDEGPEGVLVGINRENGGDLWRFDDLDGKVWGGLTVDANGVLYLATTAGTVYALQLNADSQPPRELWRYNVGAAVVAKLTVEDGQIYFGSLGADGEVFSLNHAARLRDPAGAGDLSANEWRFATGAWVWGEAALRDGAVYVGNLSGDVYALDAATGAPKWTEPRALGGPIVGGITPFVNLNDNLVLATPLYDATNGLTLISADTGALSGGEFNTASGVASPAAHAGQFLYVQNLNGATMVFNINTLALQSCGMFTTSNAGANLSICSN